MKGNLELDFFFLGCVPSSNFSLDFFSYFKLKIRRWERGRERWNEIQYQIQR